jgi:hypothetical protein
MISMTFAPIPMKLEKGKWMKITGTDYWMHYLEWISIVHAFTAMYCGGMSMYTEGVHLNDRTTFWQYV